MNNKRSGRTIITGLLFLTIIGLSVAYAVLSQQLTITGVGRVKSSTWSIYFADLSSAMMAGKASVDTEATLENNSTTMTFAVSLRQPGDSITYIFNVTNGGTIDAEVSSVTLSGVTEAELADVTYTLTYADGTPITIGDQLLAGKNKALTLTIAYNESATTVPEEDIVLNLGATITYVQM